MLQEKPSDLKREHPSFQNKKFLIFALLDPDPDYESGSETPISRFSLPPAGDVCTLALQTVTLVLFLFHIVTMFVLIPLPVQNIVSTVNMGSRLDLKKIALHARNAEYNPKVQCCGSRKFLYGSGSADPYL
jgi:hypothetical protein